MSQQIQISGGAKVRDLQDVIIGTSGVLSSLAFNVANGVPKLDVNGKILVSQLPNSVMEYKGTWNVSTNTPTLVNGTGNQGDVYLVEGAAVGGTAFNFGAGPITFFNGDQAIYSGSIWQRGSGATGTVTSVAVTETGDSLNITGSPITTSGTINIGFNGTNLQYVNGAGNLTTFPILTGYVPYTGATQDVDLGAFSLNGKSLHIKGTAGNGHLGLKHQSAAATGSANESLIYADTLGDLSWLNGNLYLSKFITSGNTAARSYTFPNATGTVALTSDLSNYVDLTTAQTIGGTKTFTDATKNNGGIFLQNASSGSLAGYMNIGGLTNGVKFTSGGGVSNTFTLPSATGYDYTFPNATGTIALTTDLSGYVTLATTQTITGAKTFSAALVGTSATFSSSVTASLIIKTGGTGGVGIIAGARTTMINNNYAGHFDGIVSFAGVSSLGGVALGFSTTRTNAQQVIYLNATDSTNPGFTIQNAAGTIVTTISNTGAATFSGALSGTTATFATASSGASVEILKLNNSGSGANTKAKIQFAAANTNYASISGGYGSSAPEITYDVPSGIHTFNQALSGTSATFSGNVTASGTGNTTIKVESTSGGFPLFQIKGTGTVTWNIENGRSTSNLLGIYQSGGTGGGVTYFSIAEGGSTSINSTLAVSSSVTAASFIPSGATVPTNGMYLSAANTLNFATASTNRLTLDASGNLLVGGTSVYGATITAYASATRGGGLGIRNSAGTAAGFFGTYAAGSGGGSTDIFVEATGFMLFNAGGSERMRIFSDGNVGIATGATNAGFKLDVNGTARVSGQLTANSFVPTSSTIPTNGMYLSAANTLNFATASTNAMTLNASGQLGVKGTATLAQISLGVSTANTTSSKIAVYDNIGSNFWGIGLTSYSSVFGLGLFSGTTATGTPQAILTQSGRLLIGTTTESTYLLDVNGTGRFSGAVTIGVSGFLSTTNLGTSAAYMTIQNSGGTTYIGRENSTGTNVGATAYSTFIYSGGPYPLEFFTNGTKQLSISSTGAATFSSGIATLGYTASTSYAALFNGNVGIGTATPTSRLEVFGGSLATAGNGINFSSQLTTGRTGTYEASTLGSIHNFLDNSSIEVASGSTSGWVSAVSVTGNNATLFTGTVRFITQSVERMRITSGGNVLIGTTDDGGRVVSYTTTAATQFKAAGTAPAITFSNTVLSPTIGGVLGVCTAASQFFTGTASSDMVLANQFSAGDLIFGTNNLARMRVKASGVINITSIPTSSAGLVSGDIYSSAGVLMIV